MADNFRSDRSRGPISDLVRLISEVHGQRAHVAGDHETVSVGYSNEPPRFPGPERTFEVPGQAYDVENRRCAADERYQIEGPRMRRRSRSLVMAITGLALLGTAGALGYRDIFGGSVLPNRPSNITRDDPNTIAPASSQPQAGSGGVESQIAAETTGSIENMLSHANQSVTHSTAAPIALANANSTAEVTRPALGGGYAVQVTSERSEMRAQGAFRALQAKYPDQLRGRRAIIRRADRGAAGIHFRALVGPFGSAEKAAKWCSGLKAAGGDCITRKN
jgi:SPOR domain